MALRFIGDSLLNDKGEKVKVSYEELLKACLKEEYDTTTVSIIIFTGIQEITGERVVKNNYRQSNLFNRLEDDILKDKNYQRKRMKIEEERQKDFANRPETDIGTRSEGLMKIERYRARKPPKWKGGKIDS